MTKITYQEHFVEFVKRTPKAVLLAFPDLDGEEHWVPRVALSNGSDEAIKTALYLEGLDVHIAQWKCNELGI